MDNGFMFTQKEFDKYTDNSAFMAKAFTPRRLVLPLIAVLAAGVSMLVGGLTLNGAYGSLSELIKTNPSSFSQMPLVFAFVDAVFLIGIGIALFRSSSAGGRKIPSVSSVVLLAGSAVSLAVSLWAMFLMLSAPGNGSDNIMNLEEKKLVVLIIWAVPLVLLFLQSFCGIFFYWNVTRTLSGKGLFKGGAKLYSIFSDLLAVCTAIVGLLSMNYLMTAVILLLQFPLAIIAAIYARIYVTAVRAADRSISMGGVNFFMGENGGAAQYYQSAYTSPQEPDDSAAPENISMQSSSESPLSRDIGISPISYSADSIPGIVPDEPALQEETECPMCGRKNPEEESFCKGCGYKLR